MSGSEMNHGIEKSKVAHTEAMPSVARRLSVAPMMEWTDRHCRRFHRQFTRRAMLYTEMLTANALLHGDPERWLKHDPVEHPLALQLGGSEPEALFKAVRIARDFGFAEINLNCGCPSDRVQNGAFGACLMRQANLVEECVAAMIEAAGGSAPRDGASRTHPTTAPEITVKCRIGVDEQDPEDVLPTFIDRVASAGVRAFAVHARKAWLQGLSPKENRTVPPLDYDLVRRVRAARPDLEIALNGGVETLDDAVAHLDKFDGVMIGRAAYHNPCDVLSGVDRRVFGESRPDADPFEAVRGMYPHIEVELAEGTRLHQITRHMLGAFAGRPGARRWRRVLSDAAHLPEAQSPVRAIALIEEALSAVAPAHAA